MDDSGPPFQVRILPPDSNQFLVGQDLTFLCEVPLGSPTGRPQWRGPDGMPIFGITQGALPHMSTQEVGSYMTRLVIRGLRREDAGTYTCYTGPHTATFTITLQGGGGGGSATCPIPCLNGGTCMDGTCVCPQEFTGQICERMVTPFAIRIVPPSDTTPTLGQMVSFNCELRTGGQYTSPVWRSPNGLPISPRGVGNQRMFTQATSPYNTALVIENLQVSDSGTYTCSAGPLTTSFTISIPDARPCLRPCQNGGSCVNGNCACPPNYAGDQCQIPTIGPGGTYRITITPSSNQVPRIGGNIDFDCRVSDNSVYLNPVWRDANNQIIPSFSQGVNGRLFTIPTSSRSSTLYINNLMTSDAGRYTCTTGPLTARVDIQTSGGTVPTDRCFPPCSNGGSCVLGRCVCLPGFSGNACESPETTHVLTVMPVTSEQPRLGDTLILLCQSPGNNPYGNPVWLDSQQQPILPRLSGTQRVYVDTPIPGTTRLNINALSPQDAGTYTCQAGPLRTIYDIAMEAPVVYAGPISIPDATY
ncbi:uncharacterized protein [Diadema antillarum]|uniref:uncharacterized protein n=1 Tax=Diadema antillarum TaxID=105358 RepID=UPI003A8A2660